MQLVWPEVFAEVRSLTITATGIGLAVGALLWVFGWLGHRFWIVLLATAAAGILGLYLNPVFGTGSVLLGVLLALAAGMLALALVRVVAFAAGGLALWMALRTLAPPWNDPIICFLAGGLAGLLMFRLWMMALTSFGGTMLMTYFGLSLAERLAKLDGASLIETRTVLLNCIIGGVALVGLGLQLLIDRRWQHGWRRRSKAEESDEEDDERPRQRNGRKFYRRAG
jgi:MFS family permease